ncbi:MAG: Crp/Fnr family transcriptional regulator [Bacteroidota bacterium]
MNLEKLETKTYNRSAIILRPGVICRFGFYVIKGCLKSYVIDNSGKEHILQFTPEGWFVSDIESFMTGKPSLTYIEAIEKTEVRLFPNLISENQELLSKEEVIEQNHKLIRNILATNKRLASILASTAEERYLEFLKTYPSLFQRLPLKLIASYIGVTPEYLSDIRRRLMKK